MRNILIPLLVVSFASSVHASFKDEHPEYFSITSPPQCTIQTVQADELDYFVHPLKNVTFKQLIQFLQPLGGTIHIVFADDTQKSDIQNWLDEEQITTDNIVFDVQFELETNGLGQFFPFIRSCQGKQGVFFIDPKYFPNRPHDDAFGSYLAEKKNCTVFRPPVFLWHGLIEQNQALCIVSTKVFKSSPGLTNEQIETVLHNYLGCTNILPVQGLIGDSHERVDTFIRFLNPDTVAIGVYTVEQDAPNRLVQLTAKEKVESVEGLNVLEFPMPDPIGPQEARLFPSYLPFLKLPHHLLVPVYPADDKYQEEAINIIKTYMSNYEVATLDNTTMLQAGLTPKDLVATVPLSNCLELPSPTQLCDTSDILQCDVCWDECWADFVHCLDDQNLITCVQDPDTGCFVRDIQPCGQDAECKQNQCVAKPSPCEGIPEKGKCELGVLIKCVDGKLIKINCTEQNQVCQVGEDGYAHCVPLCQNECNPDDYPTCLDNTQLQTCIQGEDGCYHLSTQQCEPPSQCIDGACQTQTDTQTSYTEQENSTTFKAYSKPHESTSGCAQSGFAQFYQNQVGLLILYVAVTLLLLLLLSRIRASISSENKRNATIPNGSQTDTD